MSTCNGYDVASKTINSSVVMIGVPRLFEIRQFWWYCITQLSLGDRPLTTVKGFRATGTLRTEVSMVVSRCVRYYRVKEKIPYEQDIT